jgi:ATP-dependent DNA helicase RecG
MSRSGHPRRRRPADVDIDVDSRVDIAGLGGGEDTSRQLAFVWEAPRTSHVRLMSVDEIYEQITQPLLSELEEDNRFERKPPGVSGRLLGEYFAMYANTEPDGGMIGIGIEDDGSITGLNQYEQKRINDLEKAGSIYCPQAKYKMKRVPVINKKGAPDFILLTRVAYDPHRVVEDVEGNAFVRLGDSKKRLTEAEKHELKIAKGQIDFEQESAAFTFPDDFDSTLLSQYIDTVRRERRLSNTLSATEILQLRRLGKVKGGKFIPNVACVLLFAKDPQTLVPGCKIRFLRYDGDEERTGERLNVVKDILVEGPVPVLVREAEVILNSQLREFTHLGPDNKFYSATEYPKDAWYEAIVNACVHRSYNLRNMHVFVKMFDNRLMIESPGGFMPFVTPDNIYDMHEPRNPHLMDAMFYMKFVHCGHEGTRRMRDSMARMSLPAPEFSQKQIGNALVRVTLRNNISHRRMFVDTDAFKVVGEELAQQLDADERRVVNFIAEHGKINVAQAMKLTGIRWHTIKSKMLRLVDIGVLTHIHKPDVERDRMAHFVLRISSNGGGSHKNGLAGKK